MKNVLMLLFLSLIMGSCTKNSVTNIKTSQGRILLTLSEDETAPLEGIEVFIRTSQCESECFLCLSQCEFIENLEERAYSDDQGNYTITFDITPGRSFGPEIVVPENYRLIRSGSRDSNTTGETFYHDFLLEKIN